MNLPPPPDIFESLRYFRAHSMFCDVRLRFPDSLEFFVHRVVLAAASSYFRDRLTKPDGIQVVLMPEECPVEVAAFILSWLYLEPTKLELSDQPENLDFLMKLRFGAEFLGITDLQYHVDVILNGIQGIVKKELDDDGDPARMQLQLRQPIADPPTSRRRAPNKKTSISRPKRLVVELKRFVGDDDDADDDADDDGEAGVDAALAPIVSANGSVDDSTHDSGVGDLPDGVSSDDPPTYGVGVEIKTEIGADPLLPLEESVKKKTVARTKASTATSLAGKRRKKRKFALSNPPCAVKRREKVLAQKMKEKEERDNQMITCEHCGKDMKRGQLSRHNHNVHRWVIWKKKNGPINDPTLLEHLDDRQFECKRCGFIIPREHKKFEREAAKHLYKTHNILCTTLGFACPHEGCTSVQWTKTRLAKHEKDKHLQPRVKVTCHICKKKLLETSIKAHMEDLHGDKPNQHLCETCGRGFPSKSKVRSHERFAHYNQKGVFHCDKCDDKNDKKMFKTTSRESLLHHQYYLHGILQEGATLYSCDQCDFKTPVRFNINRHIKRKHEETTPFPCPECGKTFKLNSFLEAHITRMHRSGESHPCDECEAVFRSAAGLRYHRWKFHRTGSNGTQRDDPDNWVEKPFMCAYCNHASGLAGNLKKHLANMHKGWPVKVIDLRKERKKSMDDHRGGPENDDHDDDPAAGHNGQNGGGGGGDDHHHGGLEGPASDKAEIGAEMRRIDMIVNQIANRII